MDARHFLLTLAVLFAWTTTVHAQVFIGPRSVVQSPNFRVVARDAALANEIARVAEESRKQLAVHWLGQVIPDWPQPCPLIVNDGPRTPASGETKYTLVQGGVANFHMTVSGTQERIIDSVLPHEITHTILASHFAPLGKPVPRWADEGACTTVEHVSERSKHDQMLVKYMSEGRGIPFATLFSLREYPPDMMPLYAQGYSLSCFLIAQGSPRQFVQFLERGMETEDWSAAVEEFYEYPLLGKLQVSWNQWVSDGGGRVESYTAAARGLSTRNIASNGQPNRNAMIDSGVRTASATEPTGVNLGYAPNPPQFAGPAVVPVNSSNVPNKSMNPSGNSYYLEQLRRTQQSAIATNPSVVNPGVVTPGMGDAAMAPRPQTPSNFAPNAIPHRVSQPAPFQSVGSGTILR